MKSHLVYAHRYWESVVIPGNLIIDATVGNGHDTLFLAKLLRGEGQLIGYDIQQEALNRARTRLEELHERERKIVCFKHQSHAYFDESGVELIVYNLGYLPGGNKSLTTRVETTLKSIESALGILAKKGAISITCYPGHEEGHREQVAILGLLKSLSSVDWTICFHEWLNRPLSPTLIWLQRVINI